MTSVAVVAHRDKRLGGGLPELRQTLIANGVTDPLWFEVSKSAKAPKRIRRAVKLGADLVFVWGGDGMVQRCIDAVGGFERRHRDPAGRDGESPRHQPRHPEGPGGGRRHRPPRFPPVTRRRRAQR